MSPASNDSVVPVAALALAGLSELWQETLGDPGVTIAVLDGPVDTSHGSLSRAAMTQVDFVGCGGADGLARHHGTHTASIIFGHHESPVKGIAPLCRGLIVPIFRDSGQGEIAPCSQPDLARAIRLATNAGAHVINVSAGQFSSCGAAHPLLVDAVRHCAEQGRLIVAAAGNDGCECLHVPGALPSVLAVGAMDDEGNAMEFSNWGPQYQESGILAPGVNILGAVAGDGVARRSGTSFAAPIVSGVAGLLLSLQRKHGRPPDAAAVRAALLGSALGCEHRPVPDCRRLLTGRLNVSGAVSRTLEGAIKMIDQTRGVEVDGDVASSNAATVESANARKPELESPCNTGELAPLASESPARAEWDSRESAAPGPRGPVNSRRLAAAAPGVAASDCACQRTGEMVYVIGDLDVDFGTQARLDSIQFSAETFNSGRHLDVRINGHFLRHLLGWRESEGKPPDNTHKPHRYEAKSVIWVLRQDESPLYAIAPSGPFAEAAYEELARFLMEQEGYSEAFDSKVGFYPSLDTEHDANKTSHVGPIVERVAVPGRLNGTVELMNGMTVPVINPEMRGTLSWSLEALQELRVKFAGAEQRAAERADKETPPELFRMRYLDGLQQRFFELARNPGRTPEERALNFMATESFKFAPTLRDYLHLSYDPQLDNISVKRSPMCREDSLCYDAELELFNPDNVLDSKFILARTVDVSDVVPVPIGDLRIYRRR